MIKKIFLVVPFLFLQRCVASLELSEQNYSLLSCPVYNEIVRIGTNFVFVENNLESMKHFITPYFQTKKCQGVIKTCLECAKKYYLQSRNFQYCPEKLFVVQNLNDLLTYALKQSISPQDRQNVLITMYYGLFLYCNRWRNS